MSTPAPADALVQRILAGDAPAPLRAAAARGALPLPRAALVRLFIHLGADPDEQIRSDAAASLAALTGDAIREVLADPSCPGEVLTHFAPVAAKNESLAEMVAFHPGVPDAALHTLASEGNASVIELVLTNQERLLSSPGILDRLSTNPALRADQRGKILDLLARFFKPSAEGSKGEEAPAGATEVSDDPAEAARILEVDVGDLYASSEILDGDEFERSDDHRMRSVYRKILTLNTAQKALLAMKGGREERTILVRDSNKVVALAVFRNPRLTEEEVESIAAMRNVAEEVLRTVATNREWSMNYAVMATLVRNPRTPQGLASNFVPHLTNKDLKLITMDRNVPEMIRRNAKRTFDLRTQKTTPLHRKK